MVFWNIILSKVVSYLIFIVAASWPECMGAANQYPVLVSFCNHPDKVLAQDLGQDTKPFSHIAKQKKIFYRQKCEEF
jgi:hypothetical protein